MTEHREPYITGPPAARRALAARQRDQIMLIRLDLHIHHLQAAIEAEDRSAAAYAEVRNLLRDAKGIIRQAMRAYRTMDYNDAEETPPTAPNSTPPE